MNPERDIVTVPTVLSQKLFGTPITRVRQDKVRLTCQECGRKFNVSSRAADPRCPKCGSVDWEVEA